MNDSAIYYVYVYLDPRKPGTFVYGEYSFDHEPFYVGKGKGNRCNDHLLECNLNSDGNKHKTRKIKQILNSNASPIILKVSENMMELDSNILERYIISLVGRADKLLGCLVNMTDGGEGQSGKIMSQQNKDAISKANKGRKLTPEHISKIVHYGDKHPLYGTNRSDDTKQKISDANKRYSMSVRGNIELSIRSLDFDYSCIEPNGLRHDHIIQFGKFCTDRGFTTAAVCYSLKHGTGVVKGYKFERICVRKTKRQNV